MDMFWYAYEIVPLAANDSMRRALFTREFWDNAEKLGIEWRSSESGVLVSAFPAMTPLTEDGRIAMRGLYVPAPPASFIKRLIRSLLQLDDNYLGDS